MFDRILEVQLAKAFKDVGMHIETYGGWHVPKIVTDKLIENTNRCNKVSLDLWD